MIIMQGYFFPAWHCWSQPIIVPLLSQRGSWGRPTRAARARTLHDFFFYHLVLVMLLVLCALQSRAGGRDRICPGSYWDDWWLSQPCTTFAGGGWCIQHKGSGAGIPSCSLPGCWEPETTSISSSRAGAACLSPSSGLPHQAPKTCTGALHQTCSHSEGGEEGSDPPCSRSLNYKNKI